MQGNGKNKLVSRDQCSRLVITSSSIILANTIAIIVSIKKHFANNYNLYRTIGASDTATKSNGNSTILERSDLI